MKSFQRISTEALLSLLAFWPAATAAQAVGQWEIKSKPNELCVVGTGYTVGGNAAGFQGIMLMVSQKDPSRTGLIASLNMTEAHALGLVEGRQTTLHLTFSNPDLGNAFTLIPTVALPNEGSPGWNLVGPLDQTDLSFFRKYQCLDVYIADTDIRLRRINIAGSRTALDGLANCVRTALNAH